MQTLVYIMSPSYSGSTLLTLLLAQYKSISTVGELKATRHSIGDINSYRCSCGELLSECSFWKQLQTGLNNKGIPFTPDDFGTHVFSKGKLYNHCIRSCRKGFLPRIIADFLLKSIPQLTQRYNTILEKNRAIISYVLNKEKSNIFLDGSKDPERLYHLSKNLNAKIKLINLHRDGRGFVNSYIKHNGSTIEKATREWRQINKACTRIAKLFPHDSVLEIRYEDLCEKKELILTKLLEFIGASHERSDIQSHILGNAMRFSFDGTVKRDEKWKHNLSQNNLSTFQKYDKGLNRKFGYK